MRKELESWLRGETEQDTEAVNESVTETVTETVISADNLRLLVAPLTNEPEELPEAENIAGEVLYNALNESADERTDPEIQTGITGEEIEEAEASEENIPAENLLEDDPETEESEGTPDHEPNEYGMYDKNENNEDRYGDNEKQPGWDLLEDTGSRLAMRLRHIKNMRRVPHTNERGGFRKSRGRFFTLCVLAVILIGTITALYRNMQRTSYGAMMENARGLYLQEQYAAAFEAYHETSRRYPSRAEPFLGTAHSAERMGRVDDAIAAYRACLALMPIDAMQSRANVFYEIGRLHVMLKAWDRAQESFEEAIAADAANYGAYFSLGNVLEEQGQLGKALAAYRQALDLSPSSDAAREAVRRVSLIVSAMEEVEKEALVERNYEQAFISGRAALENERYSEASRYFADALAIRSDDAGAWVGFGEARFHLGDVGGAIRSMERALERDPEHERAKSKLAEIEGQNRRNNR